MDALDELREIEAIKQLKYRYFRFLDQKEWDALRALFTEDAVSHYSGGKYSYEGRDKIMEFLEGALGRPSMLTSHHGHHPEIEITSATTAKGIWALEDVVIDTKHDFSLRGASYYADEYVKQGGAWKIQSTGYERTYEEMVSRADTPSLKLTANRFEPIS